MSPRARLAVLTLTSTLAVSAVPSFATARQATGSATPHYSPFGLSELHTTSNNTDTLQTNPLCAGWTWHHVYPLAKDSKGKDWRLNTDNLLLVTQATGLELVLTLWSAKTYNGKSYFPTDTTAWKDSVSAVVERYDGDGTKDYSKLTMPVKYWHVEEELSWWGSTWTQYSQYLGLTRRAILAADPTAKVICAGLDSNQLWGCGARAGYIKLPASTTLTYSRTALDRYEAKIDTVLKGGFYDIVDMHSYEQASILKGKCDYVRSHMYNPSLPIWSIEAGAPFYSRAQGYTDTLQAQMVVRGFCEALAVGMPRYTTVLYQYPTNSAWNSEPWTNLSILGGQTAFTYKPAYYTYQQMTQMLGGYTSVSDLTQRTSTEDRDVFHVRFVKNGAPIDIYWCDRDTVFAVPVTATAARITHILTVAGQTVANARIETRNAVNGVVTLTIGRDPVYVESTSDGSLPAGSGKGDVSDQSIAQTPNAHAGAPLEPARLDAGMQPSRGPVTLRLRGSLTEWSDAVTVRAFAADGRAVATLSTTRAALQAGVMWGESLRAPGIYWLDVRDAHAHRLTAKLVRLP